MELIPTTYRSKISKDFSFSVGAKLLSEALQDVKQYSSLSVSFHDMPTIFKSDFKNLIKNNGRIPVLCFSFRHLAPGFSASKYCIEEGFYDENWQVTVYPVPRTIKHDVQQKIIDEGLSSVISWFAKEIDPCFRGRKTCTLLYDIKTSNLLSEFETESR